MRCLGRLSAILLAMGVSLPAASAQGYGQAGNSTAGFGGAGGQGGAAIARVAVAPSGFAGGAGGFGGGQGGLAGGTQGFAGGGGGLHGVTRRTFMPEPNMIAAQFFGAGGVNVVPTTGAGAGVGGSAYYGAGLPASGRLARLAGQPVPPRRAVVVVQHRQAPLRRTLHAATTVPMGAAGTQPAEVAAPEPSFSPEQMAGVQPAQ